MMYLVPAAIAWAIAQGLKHMFYMMGRNRRVFNGTSPSWLMPSGGMPSTHSATVVAFTAFMGLSEGIDSGLFALSFLLSAIVIYDSMRVRYSSGRQGDLLNTLLTEVKSRLQPVRVAHGHTVLEVLAGMTIGVIVALVVFFTTK